MAFNTLNRTQYKNLDIERKISTATFVQNFNANRFLFGKRWKTEYCCSWSNNEALSTSRRTAHRPTLLTKCLCKCLAQVHFWLHLSYRCLSIPPTDRLTVLPIHYHCDTDSIVITSYIYCTAQSVATIWTVWALPFLHSVFSFCLTIHKWCPFITICLR